MEASNSPVFVVAYPHSGTTMLRDSFAACRDVFACAGETSFFERLPSIRRRFSPIEDSSNRRDFVQYVARMAAGFSDPIPPDAPGLETSVADELAATAGDHVALFATTLAHLASANGRTRWLEKSPTHIFEIEAIQGGLPAAKFVEMVRSPLDALGSKKTRHLMNETRRRAGRPTRDRFFHPVWDAITWRSAVAAGDRAAKRTPGAIIRIRYEDIVSEPERLLRHVCEWLGVAFGPEMVTVDRTNSAIPGSGSKREPGISSGSVDRWKTVLTPGEVAIISAITRRTARRLGYEVPHGRVDSSAVRWAARTVADPATRLTARVRRSGWRSATHAVRSYIRRSS